MERRIDSIERRMDALEQRMLRGASKEWTKKIEDRVEAVEQSRTELAVLRSQVDAAREDLNEVGTQVRRLGSNVVRIQAAASVFFVVVTLVLDFLG